MKHCLKLSNIVQFITMSLAIKEQPKWHTWTKLPGTRFWSSTHGEQLLQIISSHTVAQASTTEAKKVRGGGGRSHSVHPHSMEARKIHKLNVCLLPIKNTVSVWSIHQAQTCEPYPRWAAFGSPIILDSSLVFPADLPLTVAQDPGTQQPPAPVCVIENEEKESLGNPRCPNLRITSWPIPTDRQ